MGRPSSTDSHRNPPSEPSPFPLEPKGQVGLDPKDQYATSDLEEQKPKAVGGAFKALQAKEKRVQNVVRAVDESGGDADASREGSVR